MGLYTRFYSISCPSYQNQFLQVPIFIVAMDWKFPKFGRRMVFLIFWIALALIIIILEIIVGVEETKTDWERAFGLLGASIAASGGWMILVILSVEAYPTAIRGLTWG